MDMTGSRRIEAPRERVWDALNDPAVLQASIPGCESVERTGPESFAAKVAVKIGPMSARFGGKVTLTNIDPPRGYTITGDGQGGAMGFARGGADVSLVEEGPSTTTLNYTVKAQVGGKMAQLGARLVDSTARQMADQFFDRFAAQVAGPVAGPVPEPASVASQPAVPELEAATAGALPDATPQDGTPHRAARVSPPMPALSDPAPDAVPTIPDAVASTGQPVAERRTAVAALRPGPAAGNLAAMLAALPREPFGLPLTLWIGGVVFLGILALLFVVG